MKGGWRCQFSSQKLESIFFGVASYLDLGDGISLDLGDVNRLGWVVQVVIAASQRYGFVLRLIASAYVMHTQPEQGQRGSLRWNFSVDFVNDLMGRFVVTDDLIRI